MTICYFCGKECNDKRMKVAESPKDHEGGGIVVPVCDECYGRWEEE